MSEQRPSMASALLTLWLPAQQPVRRKNFLPKRKRVFNSLKVMCVIFGRILKNKKKSSLFPKIARRRRVS